MADTFPHMIWSVAYECPLRDSLSEHDPSDVFVRLSPLRSYYNTTTQCERFQGFFITSHLLMEIDWDRMADDPNGPIQGIRIPNTGLREGFGMPDLFPIALSSCAKCPANIAPSDEGGILGCHGSFSIHPEDSQFNRAMKQSAADIGITISDYFLETDPMIYGLWSQGNLSQVQQKILTSIFMDLPIEFHSRIDHFIHALTTCIDFGLDMLVKQQPLAHTDFGLFYTFPHCPRCKAPTAQNHEDRWKEIEETRVTCHCCGLDYDPSKTKSTSELDIALPSGNLRSQLGLERYLSFANDYLTSKSIPLEKIAEILTNLKQTEGTS